eukprot:CAMPEP_0197194152 /NCGR_PEP_ID=MMETSP1423-20130617/28702_1 /TAXON_ID=476441 /ORGANISM="Pseudo-nitzschia heimii, Strain UNC1101" /LENGTH=574 /DNA_ID=CAMNT_0042647525 /DNA_START=175 /DNA_END=1896 /DNA_ORIENTATION=-
MTKTINRKDKSLDVSDISFVEGDESDTCSSSAAFLSESLVETECSLSVSSSCELDKSVKKDGDHSSLQSTSSFLSFRSLRLNYLLVTLVIMLADGLQGTHLYVLYEGYGFNVASLYALGFITGAVTTPITGPLIDKFGRKKSAMLYCVLEMGINLLEQYPFLSGLLLSRMVGGITTNLLSSVFETWLDTEFRNRHRTMKSGVDSAEITDDDTTSTLCSNTDNFDDIAAKNEYELIMRDSVIISNLASIASGYLAHLLAERYGSVGPFQGAVSCTGIALIVITFLWNENYGTSSASTSGEDEGEGKFPDKKLKSHGEGETKSVMEYMKEAIAIFQSNPKILYLGIIQGLSVGSLQIFIFLWSPTLQIFSSNDNTDTAASDGDNQFLLRSYSSWAVDGIGNPAYGLIFGAFMAAGVSGGLCAPSVRRAVGLLFKEQVGASALETIHLETEETRARSIELEFLIGFNYICAAALMLVPSFLTPSSVDSFSIALLVFVIYEFLVGITMPCEGVIRSLYLPSDGRATMMMVPRMVVNLAVSVGVLLTKYISEQLTFVVIALLMACSGFMQLSFISRQEW